MEHRPRWEGEVLVPAGQAWLIGFGVGLGSLALSIPLAIWQHWPWWVPLAVAVGLACLAFGIAAVLLVLDHRRLLWAWEEAVRFDLDGDGVVGEPESEKALTPEEPRFAYVNDPYRRRRLLAARDFRFFLREAYDGRGTTWRAWDGVVLPSGRRVTRPLWEEYTERLLKAGLAVRDYPTAPLRLVSEYRDALEAFRELL
ncbi:MAG TPA: hypothetical protein G4O00_06345 [Thermoflexia bacterium]|jgi:hypothetical protein|nr:hypothetical protein [Thermoflexia bacterium]